MDRQLSNLLAQGARNDLLNYALMVEDEFDINWHHKLVADKLMQIYDGLGSRKGLKKLMIAMPPQVAGKSTLVSKLFPSWTLGKRPATKILVGSYNLDLATTQSKKSMNIVKEEVYNDIFDTKLRPDKRSVAEWGVVGGKDGGYRAFGMKTGVTGRPADCLILDDPIKGREAVESKKMRDSLWAVYTDEVLTRLLPESSMVIVFTRWHLDDIVGRIERNLIEQGLKLEDEWEVLHLPAIATKDEKFELSTGEIVGRKKGDSLWEERYSNAWMEKKKTSMPVTTWASLYQQNPITSETQVFKQEMFQTVREEELRQRQFVRMLAIDTSSGSGTDYTGFADVRIEKSTGFWYVKAWHEMLKPLELIDKMFNLRAMNRYDKIGMEKTMFKQVIEPFLQKEMLRRNEPFYVEELLHGNVSKNTRVYGLEPRYSSGQIFHLENKCGTLEEELLLYGSAPNDDVADALAYISDLISQVNIKESNDVVVTTPDIPNYT